MVQAVERAKQVTMAELNAIIGVRGLSILALITLAFALALSRALFKFCSVEEAKGSRGSHSEMEHFAFSLTKLDG